MTDDFKDIDPAKIIEFPVAEEMQMGASIGMALEGKTVVSIYPRFDFLILATNQIVNHLDKLAHLYRAGVPGKVIIRTSVGGRKPLDGGPQHTQDHFRTLGVMSPNLEMFRCNKKDDDNYLGNYQWAYNQKNNCLLAE